VLAYFGASAAYAGVAFGATSGFVGAAFGASAGFAGADFYFFSRFPITIAIIS